MVTSIVQLTGSTNKTAPSGTADAFLPARNSITLPESDFGAAVEVDLSDLGRAALASAAPTSATSLPATNNEITTYPANVTDKIADSKRRVQPSVGISGANEVVDSNGNIDTAKLYKLISLQS